MFHLHRLDNHDHVAFGNLRTRGDLNGDDAAGHRADDLGLPGALRAVNRVFLGLSEVPGTPLVGDPEVPVGLGPPVVAAHPVQRHAHLRAVDLHTGGVDLTVTDLHPGGPG